MRVVRVESPCQRSFEHGMHVWFVTHHSPDWKWLGARCNRCGNTSGGRADRFEYVWRVIEQAWLDKNVTHTTFPPPAP